MYYAIKEHLAIYKYDNSVVGEGYEAPEDIAPPFSLVLI